MFRKYFPITILVLWVLIIISGLIFPFNPNQIDLSQILVTPDWNNLLGTDDLGRSVLDRAITGGFTSFIVAAFVTLISVIVGTAIGCASGYIGGWFDAFTVRIIDIFLAFPGILLAIALSGVMGPGIENVIIALSIVGWVGYARLSRAQVLTLKNREHVLAAHALGTSNLQIIKAHILPLIMAPLIVEGTFGIAGIVIAEAGLSYLGLGVQPPASSWGSMIRDGSQYLLVAPHMVIAPGVILMLVVMSVNLLGDQIRDYLDVKDMA